jgi:uncharacterized membrane protein
MDTRRAESFSDGVFAVAITVLVFNLLTIGEGKTLTYHQLLGQSWPQYTAYVVGFLTIGIMWMNHHTMVAHLARVDRIALVLNIFLLMGVVAIPFTTALVADHLNSPDAASGRVAAVAYGVVSIAIAIAFSGMWAYLAAHQESLAAGPIQAPWQATARFGAGLVGYVIGTLVAAFLSSGAALAIYGLIAVYYLFEHLPAPAGGDPLDLQDAPSGP